MAPRQVNMSMKAVKRLNNKLGCTIRITYILWCPVLFEDTLVPLVGLP